MTWRIYRLPGSRRLWHIDTGPGTAVVNVYAWQSQLPVHSVDLGDVVQVPRAWVEISGDVHLLISKTWDGCGYKAPELRLPIAQFVSGEWIASKLEEPKPESQVSENLPKENPSGLQ